MQPGCLTAQMCCVTFSLGCGGSAPLLLPSVSFVWTFPRWLSGAVCPSDFHVAMRFFLIFFFWVPVPEHLLSEQCLEEL